MRNVFKSTILGMGLLAGVAVGAYAQTDNVAALPPGAQAPTPPAAASLRRLHYVGPAGRPTGRPGEADTAGAAFRGAYGRPGGRLELDSPGEADRACGPVAGLSRRASELIGVFRLESTGRPPPAPACFFASGLLRITDRRFRQPWRSGTCGGTGTASCRRAAADKPPRPARRTPLRSGCARARRAPPAAARATSPWSIP